MPHELRPIVAHDETDIRWTYAVSGRSVDRVVVVTFTGNYGFGSGGNDDAPHMEAAVRAAHAYSPRAIVLDLRRLSYRWGDMMSEPLGAAHVHDIACTIVVSDACRVGLTSFIQAEWMSDPADYLFDTLDAAIDRSLANIEQRRRVMQVLWEKGESDLSAVLAGADSRTFLLGELVSYRLRVDPALLRQVIAAQVAAGSGSKPDYGGLLERGLERLLRLEEHEAVPFVREILSKREESARQLYFWDFGTVQLERLADAVSPGEDLHTWIQAELHERQP